MDTSYPTGKNLHSASQYDFSGAFEMYMKVKRPKSGSSSRGGFRVNISQSSRPICELHVAPHPCTPPPHAHQQIQQPCVSHGGIDIVLQDIEQEVIEAARRPHEHYQQDGELDRRHL